MAMAVPYQPVPSQTLEPTATPEMNPRIPAAAFGGEVAQALSGFGKTVEGAGDQIFNKALALQNLANEAEAKNAASDYQIQAGKLHADYSSLQGKEAVDGFQPYTQKLKALRESIRGGLKTAMSQKDFDSDSLSTMGRTIFNGAGHAATQNKQYIVGASDARVDIAGDSLMVDPSPNNLKIAKATAEREIRETQGPAKGLSPEATDEAVKTKTSSQTLKYLVGLSRTKPFEAKDQLNAMKAELTPDDFLKADNIVRSQSRAVGSANIAREVYEGGQGDATHPAKSASEMEAEVRAKAKTFDPEDPLLESHAVAAFNGRLNQDKYNQARETRDNQATLNQAIVSGVRNEQELRADPKAAAAADALIAAGKKLNLPAEINNYNSARDRKDNMERFNTLMGTANNDVEGFLNYNPRADDKLSQGQINAIVAKQDQLKKQVGQDPRVDRAIGWMRGAFGAQMEALGVFKRTQQNKDDYDHLTGTVQSALDLWQDNHGKPPTYKEFQEQIGPQILQQRSEPAWFGLTTSKKPFFARDVPEEFSSSVKADVLAKGGSEPSEQDLYKAYVRTQLMKLYPASKKSDAP